MLRLEDLALLSILATALIVTIALVARKRAREAFGKGLLPRGPLVITLVATFVMSLLVFAAFDTSYFGYPLWLALLDGLLYAMLITGLIYLGLPKSMRRLLRGG